MRGGSAAQRGAALQTAQPALPAILLIGAFLAFTVAKDLVKI